MQQKIKLFFIAILIFPILQSCQEYDGNHVEDAAVQSVTLPLVRAKSDSLFPGLQITSLSWAKENFFSFHTDLEQYAGYQLYKLEKNAKGYVTLLVFKNTSGHILGIDCSTLPSRMMEADTEADFNAQTGTYVRTDLPTSETYGEGDAVSKSWFLQTLATGLNRLKFQDYVYVGPGKGGTAFRKKSINADGGKL